MKIFYWDDTRKESKGKSSAITSTIGNDSLNVTNIIIKSKEYRRKN